MSESSDGNNNSNGDGNEGRGRHRKRAITIAAAAVAVEVAGLWRRGYGVGGNVVVRCRADHLFTTIWLPAVSLKSLRLGLWRFQYCPVGKHWSVVTPVKRAELSSGELQDATEHRDIRVP
jgi:hypothetical protein